MMMDVHVGDNKTHNHFLFASGVNVSNETILSVATIE
jgi:tetrahydromethanopterin S-methyltransferase subunit E